jgi:hypothetical protein
MGARCGFFWTRTAAAACWRLDPCRRCLVNVDDEMCVATDPSDGGHDGHEAGDCHRRGCPAARLFLSDGRGGGAVEQQPVAYTCSKRAWPTLHAARGVGRRRGVHAATGRSNSARGRLRWWLHSWVSGPHPEHGRAVQGVHHVPADRWTVVSVKYELV